MVGTHVVSSSVGRSDSDDFSTTFWQLWQQYQDDLYRCCLKWMSGNRTNAEDALSRTMLKAWEKVQKYAGKIANFKGWLTRLAHNLCVDIHREGSRGANRVEDIEVYTRSEEQGLVDLEKTPLCAVETDEKRIVIRQAIANLPTRLRETFILHFYKELSYPEIAQLQEVSYQNVCKRISQARKILQQELRGYFFGEERTVPPTATESKIREISQERAGETVASVAVEEVESIGGEKSIEVARDVEHSESATVAVTSEGKDKTFKKDDGIEVVVSPQQQSDDNKTTVEKQKSAAKEAKKTPKAESIYIEIPIPQLSRTLDLTASYQTSSESLIQDISIIKFKKNSKMINYQDACSEN
ncbi:MAG: sigma-70 family RNA polymerase sigma factor [Rhizonema sp. PD38]|nr:sigma-70 family RNA polymerase sigma factor [Rhizonema sp. PD38]